MACIVLIVGKLEWKSPLGRFTNECVGNIKKDLKETGRPEGVNWTKLD
jgi:hypothetical protein